MKQLLFLSSLMTLFLFAAATAEEVSYRTHIKPLFEERCAGCHGAASPEYVEFKLDKAKNVEKSLGPRMDNYTHLIYYIGWPDNGAIMRRLDDGSNTKDGKPGNMFQYLGGSDDERKKNLALFKAWVGNWNLKKWPDVTKDEMNALGLKY